jgi:hypothetical protein
MLLGDFNAWPDSDEIRRFGGYRTKLAIPGKVFLGAWEYADPAAPSATWNLANLLGPTGISSWFLVASLCPATMWSGIGCPANASWLP